MTAENIVTFTVIGTLGNPTFLCILGSRLLFNLKDAGKLEVNKGTNYKFESSVSGIDFGDARIEASEVVCSFFSLFTGF